MFIGLEEIFLFYLSISETFLFFDFSLVLVPPVSECSDSIHVEWILAHANSVSFDLTCGNMHFFINFLAIVFYLLFESFFVFLSPLLFYILFLRQLLFNLQVLTFIQGIHLAFPFPL